MSLNEVIWLDLAGANLGAVARSMATGKERELVKVAPPGEWRPGAVIYHITGCGRTIHIYI